MAIAEQFAGLDMSQLIGGPLSAAADASTQLANSTANFINKVGFDEKGNVRTAAFAYQKRSMNEDGTSNLDEMKVDVPMLAIVPIPNLQIDEVNILFDMEVKQSEKSESSTDMAASLTGSANLGFIKVSVTGSISAHDSNTRSSDNSAKYHVDVRATNHGTPEGLARVLDMMAANVAPALVGSTLKDGNGQDLSDQAKVKAEKLKAIRQEISQIENRLAAAQDGLSNNLVQLKKSGDSQLNVYQGIIVKLMQSADSDEKQAAYSQAMEEVSQSWSVFQNQAESYVKIIADSSEETSGVSELFALKALSKEGTVTEYGEAESYYKTLAAAQKSAVDSQKKASLIETELFDKKAEYNDAVTGKTPGLPEKTN